MNTQVNPSYPIIKAIDQITRDKYKGLSSINIYPSEKYITIVDNGLGGGGHFKITQIESTHDTTRYSGEDSLSLITISICGNKGILKYLTSNITIDFTF